MISVPVSREHYRVFAAAVRLIRKECGADAPSTATLIQFQLANRSAVGVAKDYLDCIGDFEGRRRIRFKAARGTSPVTRLGDRSTVFRTISDPKDPSLN
jgi:hypothetical protein